MSRNGRWEWFRAQAGLAGRGRQRAARRNSGGGFSRHRRLHVETLEDRRMMATFTVTNGLDGPVSVAGQLPGSFRQAVFDANALPGPDEIILDADDIAFGVALTEGQLEIRDSVDIRASSSFSRTFPVTAVSSSPATSRRLFLIDDGNAPNNISVKFTGVDFRNGDVTGNGGAILSREDLELLSSTFVNNKASLDGGAIFNDGGNLTFRRGFGPTDFEYFGNSAQRGGLIYSSGGNVDVTSVSFRSNTATLDGGAIYIENGNLSLIGGKFDLNSARDGGAIFARNSTITTGHSPFSSVSFPDFNSNTARNGAAIFLDEGILEIKKAVFTSNIATGAGAIHAIDADASITDSLADFNTSVLAGGFLSQENGTLEIVDSDLRNNSSDTSGGAIDALNAVVTITNSFVNNNMALSGDGGGLHVVGGSLNLIDSKVLDNSATGRGGGIFLSAATGLIDNANIAGNSANGNGAGLFLLHSDQAANPGPMGVGSTIIRSSTILGNDSLGNGGGIAIEVAIGSEVLVTNTDIRANSANVHGGGVFINDVGAVGTGGTTRFENATIRFNRADEDTNGIGAGGGVSVGSSSDSLAASFNNTIIATNIDPTGIAPDLDATANEANLTFTLLGDNQGSALAEAQSADSFGNLVGSNTGSGVIAPLFTANGLLQTGSPAIDAGDPSAVAGSGEVPLYDPRGISFSRVVDGNEDGTARIDMGASEFVDTEIRRILLDDLLVNNGGDGSLGFALLSESNHEFAGSSAAVVGDVNGDGYDDFVVGTPGAGTAAQPGAGASYLVFGSPNFSIEQFFDSLVSSTKQVVFTDDFTGGPAANWTVDGAVAATSTTPVGSREFLGELENENATLQVANLPQHEQVTIEFDLFVIGPWDGNDPTEGERWQLSIDNNTIVDTSFSNVTIGEANQQDYGNGLRVERNAFIESSSKSINESAEPHLGISSSSFGGLRSADFSSSALASLSGIPGALPDWDFTENVFDVLISTSSVNARDRIETRGQVVNANGDLLARDEADFWDGHLENGVNYNEFQQLLPDNSIFWTGSDNNGFHDKNCLNWTLGGGQMANVGISQGTINWFNQAQISCGQSYRLVGISPERASDSFSAGTGAAERDTLGYASDAVYRVSVTVNHTASDVSLELLASNLTSGENWGIDNVTLSVHDSSTPDGGVRLTGAAAGDGLGENVTPAGDFNGDGLADFLLSPVADASDTVHLVLGNNNWQGEIDLGDPGTSLRITGLPQAVFQSLAIASAGDINGDGLDDIVIGNGSASLAGGGIVNNSEIDRARSGAAYVIFGTSDPLPAEIDVSTLDVTEGFVIRGAGAGDNLGFSVSAAGDFNGDGLDDLLIGAPGDLDNPTGPVDPVGNPVLDQDEIGRVFVIYGQTTGFSAAFDVGAIDQTSGFVVDGYRAFGRLGESVSGIGDFNGDGFDDIALGAPDADTPIVESGEIYVLFGGDALAASLNVVDLDGINGTVFTGSLSVSTTTNSTGQIRAQNFGRSLAGVGDLNGDGYDDVIANDNRNRGFIFYGGEGPFPAAANINALPFAEEEKILLIQGNSPTSGQNPISPDNTADELGQGGDINGDGLSDFLVGVPQRDVNGEIDAGAVFGIYGADQTGKLDLLGSAIAETLTGTSSNELIVAGAGDDTVIGGGGLDVLNGGQGDDRLEIGDGNFRRVTGGTGIDTLALVVGLNLDLTAISDNRLQEIEQIDLAVSGANHLTLNKQEVLRLSDTSNTFIVLGNAEDTVDQGSGWQLVGTELIDTVTFKRLEQGEAVLFVADSINLTQAIGLAADFDTDGDVDGADFLAWQRGFGTQAPNATPADGDADNDQDVDAADLGIWQGQFGSNASPLAASSAGSSETSAFVAEQALAPVAASAQSAFAPEDLIDAALATEWLGTVAVEEESPVIRKPVADQADNLSRGSYFQQLQNSQIFDDASDGFDFSVLDSQTREQEAAGEDDSSLDEVADALFATLADEEVFAGL